MTDFQNTAFFVRRPFAIEDLRKPHPHKEEKPFAVVKTIGLSKIDYENLLPICASAAGLSRKIRNSAALTKTGYGNACWYSGAGGRTESW